jgi:hypothetical protein
MTVQICMLAPPYPPKRTQDRFKFRWPHQHSHAHKVSDKMICLTIPLICNDLCVRTPAYPHTHTKNPPVFVEAGQQCSDYSLEVRIVDETNDTTSWPALLLFNDFKEEFDGSQIQLYCSLRQPFALPRR